MTEEEAKRLWCPFAASRVVVTRRNDGALRQSMTVGPVLKDQSETLCIASACMAWRWIVENTPDGRGIRTSMTEGHCGLAGRP